MECVVWVCIVRGGNFEVYRHSKERQTFDCCRIYPGPDLPDLWIRLGIYMQMVVALSYKRVHLDVIMSNIKAKSISYAPWPGGRATT